jgi:hypothetical protein
LHTKLIVMKHKFLSLAMFVVSAMLFLGKANAQGNAANPYDEVGATHNKVLSDFFNEYSKDKVTESQMSEKDLYYYVCGRANTGDCDAMAQMASGEIMQATKDMSLVETAGYLQQNGMVGSQFSAYVSKLDRILTQYGAGNNNALHRAIAAVEGSILADAGLKDTERQSLLAATAVARHSAKFWTDLANGATSYAGLSNASLSAANWGRIVRADIRGAIRGFWEALRRGLNPLKGALIGAAVYSIFEAVFIFWEWLFGW